MRLKDFIERVGEEEAARTFEVPLRTVRSWRYGQRRPNYKRARLIVERSPVTMDGIYKDSASHSQDERTFRVGE